MSETEKKEILEETEILTLNGKLKEAKVLAKKNSYETLPSILFKIYRRVKIIKYIQFIRS